MPLPPDLRARRLQPEVMDQDGIDAGLHHQALDALRRVNALSGVAGALWGPIRALCDRRRRRGDGRPVRVLDLATGGGDLPLALWRRARRAGLPLEVAGCDRSPLAVEHARAHADRAGADVAFFALDALGQDLPSGYDVLTSSLFLHHLDERSAVRLLRAMRASGELALVDDLRRCAPGWLLAYAGLRVLTRSPVAHVDGPRSVEGAFTCDEVRSLAEEAGWRDYSIRRRWPCRFLLAGGRP